MKILSITPAYAPAIGGIETVVHELAKRLPALGHEVHVAHVHTSHRRLVTEQHDGVTVHRVPLRGHRLLGLAPDLGKIASEYDVLHVHDPQLMAITASVRLFAGQVPAVLSTHGGFHHTQRLSGFKRMFERLALAHALNHYRAVLASSVTDQTYFQRFSNRVRLCSNGVATDKFGRVPIENDRDMLRWVYWGRLSVNKRVDLVIQAVAQAHGAGLPVQLLVCGRDPDGLAEGLHKQVNRLGLSDSVVFKTHMSDEELLSELASRGVYVTASEHEGFGLSVVEALSAGLLVMCRDMEPLSTFITPGLTGQFLAFEDGPGDLDSFHWLKSMSSAQRAQSRIESRAQAALHSWGSAVEVFDSELRAAAMC